MIQMNLEFDASSKETTGYSLIEWRNLLEDEWNLPEEAINRLSKHFLRKWQANLILPILKDGILQHEGVSYQVRWLGGKVAATANRFCLLSFRKSPAFKHGIVIIKTFNEQQETNNAN